MSAVLVTGLTTRVDENALREFFSYSGDVTGVELHDAPDAAGGPTRSAIVSFAAANALDTALLLTGSTIVPEDPPITVVASYKPGEAAPPAKDTNADPDLIDMRRVSDALSTMMAKGFMLSKDALAKAKVRRRCGGTQRVGVGFEVVAPLRAPRATPRAC